MHIVFALFFFAHGVAHLVGFSAAWSLSPEKIPHLTTVIGGRFDVGESAIRVVGLLWVAAAVAFAVVALGAALGASWWPRVLIVVALGSLALCVLGWPEAKIGVVLNLAILVIAAMRTGWFPVAP